MQLFCNENLCAVHDTRALPMGKLSVVSLYMTSFPWLASAAHDACTTPILTQSAPLSSANSVAVAIHSAYPTFRKVTKFRFDTDVY